MKAYLTLTLDEARAIVAPGLYHRHWVEAKFAVEEFKAKRNDFVLVFPGSVSNRFGPPEDSCATHFVMTFVSMSKGEGATLKGCRGQIVVRLDPTKKSSPVLSYGPPIDDREPMIKAMKVTALLDSVRQPKSGKHHGSP